MNSKKIDAGLTVRRTDPANALAPKPSRRGIGGPLRPNEFKPQPSQPRPQMPGPGTIQAFQPHAPAQREMLAPSQRAPIAPFAQQKPIGGLPCTQPGPGAFSPDHIQCLGCGKSIPLEERDVDIVGGPYDDYSHHPHIETALYGQCDNCTSIKAGRRCTRQFVIAMTELIEE